MDVSAEAPFPNVTECEAQILNVLLDAASDQEIMRRLGLKKGLLRRRLHSIFHKLGVNSRQDAATWWQWSRQQQMGKHPVDAPCSPRPVHPGTSHPPLRVRPGKRTMFASLVLTQMERRILDLARVGKTPQEIARHLGITAKTVHNHCSRIYHKLGVHRLSSAMVCWERHLRNAAQQTNPTPASSQPQERTL